MKKFFTLLAALFVATTMMGQMHGPMKFVGASNMSVSSTSNDNPSDTILFEMADMATGHITLPAMKGMQTIPDGSRPRHHLCAAAVLLFRDSWRRGEDHHGHIFLGHL